MHGINKSKSKLTMPNSIIEEKWESLNVIDLKIKIIAREILHWLTTSSSHSNLNARCRVSVNELIYEYSYSSHDSNKISVSLWITLYLQFSSIIPNFSSPDGNAFSVFALRFDYTSIQEHQHQQQQGPCACVHTSQSYLILSLNSVSQHRNIHVIHIDCACCLFWGVVISSYTIRGSLSSIVHRVHPFPETQNLA